MNELALFAGIGGGILASHILGHRIVCAVENNPYCQSILLQRQNEGIFFPFPIWDDIRTFDGTKWRGIIDLVSGGFPCQDISSAGSCEGLNGKNSRLWFEMLRTVCDIRPRYVFVENSPMLTKRGLNTVLQGLSAARYDAEWCVLGADDCGAPHERKRIWILAKQQKIPDPLHQRARTCDRKFSDGREIVQKQCYNRTGAESVQKWKWWNIEPQLGRVANGIANRSHRLRAIGNAQVPIVAAMAFRILLQRFEEK